MVVDIIVFVVYGQSDVLRTRTSLKSDVTSCLIENLGHGCISDFEVATNVLHSVEYKLMLNLLIEIMLTQCLTVNCYLDIKSGAGLQ